MRQGLNLSFFTKLIEETAPQKGLEFYSHSKKRDIPAVSVETAHYLSQTVASLKPSSILELGCAAGVSCRYMAETADGAQMDCVDTNIYRIREAEKLTVSCVA